MANCSKCGKKVGFLQGLDVSGRCQDCVIRDASALTGMGAQRLADRERDARRAKALQDEAIEAVLLTTETATDLRILRRVEIVTAECAFGMNIFKDLFAAVRDVVGGRSEAVQATLRDARKTVLLELKREAFRVGANAVVAVDLDYTELSSGGNMVLLVASGTAVVLETPQPPVAAL